MECTGREAWQLDLQQIIQDQCCHGGCEAIVEMTNGTLSAEEFDYWAACIERTRTVNGFPSEFRFTAHPAVVQERDEAILKGVKPREVICREKILKQIFYRGDMQTMFADYKSLQEAIQSASARHDNCFKRRQDRPISSCTYPLASVEIQVHGLATKYCTEHFHDHL